MNADTADITVGNLDFASWERERSSEELRLFIERRHAALPEGVEIE
jgi:hypothetical protein